MGIYALLGDAISGLFGGLLLAIIIISCIVYIVHSLFSPYQHSLLSILSLVVLSVVIIYNSISLGVCLSLNARVNDLLELGTSVIRSNLDAANQFSSIANELAPESLKNIEGVNLNGAISEEQFQNIAYTIKSRLKSMIWWSLAKIVVSTILAVVLCGVFGQKITSTRRAAGRPNSRRDVRPRGARRR